ncbi:hypothetical protein AM493_10260 [Flavobacterium akiainvivens]|uniref:phosphoglycolate phosphatase n=1 Tax=Flavobacterium akiainvivens TaxID=1202724 RepID=A0A0M9VI88_9FLAO|nr:HAD-IA family hydrolase [Flavobacterium akiainvivens]KOS06369.1 hypothetical protein AM493_10260 [Flavobacterium akiainvivens]SFQ15011.1 haloacid dehalogenase superfamily, subfamily IA, variant 1 with third motif having Dx(3-4)D or Dx(3-4)E [Flavobacterium akiainvivens]
MKVQYIFFDFDGVLAESVNVKTEAFRKMYLHKGEDFAQRVVDFHNANGGVSRFEKIKIWNGEWLGEELTDDKITELANLFSTLSMEGVINAEEVTGALDFLTHSDQYIKYIITGTPTVEIKPILEQRGMNHFFKGIYGSPEKKDYWVKKILAEENIPAEACIFVGDALADYNAAIANDITFILRETAEAQHLFEEYTGYRIKDMTELDAVIQKINEDK